jgi:hypothetical protein
MKTIFESVQSTLIEVLSKCGFEEIAKQILNLGVDFENALANITTFHSEKEESNLSYNMLPG